MMETFISWKLGDLSPQRMHCIKYIILMSSHQMIMTPIWVDVNFVVMVVLGLFPSPCLYPTFFFLWWTMLNDVEQLSAEDLVNMKMIQFHFVPRCNTPFIWCMNQHKPYALLILKPQSLCYWIFNSWNFQFQFQFSTSFTTN